MLWYEILIIILIALFFIFLLGRYIYKRVNHLPTGECACCKNAKKNSLIKAYYKKYGHNK